ncbi:hypothetical protein JKP88DRAFT_339172 [Tribonema minus]|uniref:Nicastrin n=1 Tax=Tribonema minus TaxID=303371 RepID=A0A835YH48_9STRA|nr:hypothetical protein JKP88DRAFT_339172 [Tribonema minus]
MRGRQVRATVVAVALVVLCSWTDAKHHEGWPFNYRVQPFFVTDAALCARSGADALSGSCFLLTRANPAPDARYNTLGDLLTLTASRAFLSASRRETVTVTLAFTNGPQVCSGDTIAAVGSNGSGAAAAAWLALVDAFQRAAASQQRGAAAVVRWVLSGDALPQRCLAERWRPWPAAFTTAACPRDALTSDRRPLDRFQMLSDPPDDSLWETLASAGVDYGKFARKDFPYVLRGGGAPLEQGTVRRYLDLYEGGRGHREGFQFSTDADPAMLEVFAGRQRAFSGAAPPSGTNPRRRGISAALPAPALPRGNASAAGGGGGAGADGDEEAWRFPQLVAVAGSDDGPVTLLSIATNGTAVVAQHVELAAATDSAEAGVRLAGVTALNATVRFAALGGGGDDGAPPPLSASAARTVPAARHRPYWHKATLLLSNATGAYHLYNVTAARDGGAAAVALAPWVADGALPRPLNSAAPSLATHLFAAPRRAEDGGGGGDDDGAAAAAAPLLIAELLGGGAAADALCHPRVQLLRVGGGGALSPLGLVCLSLPERAAAAAPPAVDSGSVAVARLGRALYLFVTASAEGNLYAGATALEQSMWEEDGGGGGSASGGEPWGGGRGVGGVRAVALKWVGAGGRPHVSVQDAQALRGGDDAAVTSDVVLLLSDNGYCFDLSRARAAKGCAAIPSPTPHALDYAVATIAAWLEWLAAPPSGALSPCDARVYRGTYDRGDAPSGALFAARGRRLALAAAHAAAPRARYRADAAACGASAHERGLVLAAFPLPPALTDGSDRAAADGYDDVTDGGSHARWSSNNGAVAGVVLAAVAAALGLGGCARCLWRRRCCGGGGGAACARTHRGRQRLDTDDGGDGGATGRVYHVQNGAAVRGGFAPLRSPRRRVGSPDGDGDSGGGSGSGSAEGVELQAMGQAELLADSGEGDASTAALV